MAYKCVWTPAYHGGSSFDHCLNDRAPLSNYCAAHSPASWYNDHVKYDLKGEERPVQPTSELDWCFIRRVVTFGMLGLMAYAFVGRVSFNQHEAWYPGNRKTEYYAKACEADPTYVYACRAASGQPAWSVVVGCAWPIAMPLVSAIRLADKVPVQP